MREIKFKAKRIDNGKWVTGMLSKIPKFGETFRYVIVDVIALTKDGTEFNGLKFLNDEVDENTICEFSGLKDKNGKEIYENDILEEKDVYGTIRGKVSFGNGKFNRSHNYVELKNQKLKNNGVFFDLIFYIKKQEIIGNYVDNPELLSTPTAVL